MAKENFVKTNPDAVNRSIEKMIHAQTAQSILDNSINFNLQWMDTMLKYMEISRDNKNAVAEKVVSYIHILEAEFRRYYDL